MEDFKRVQNVKGNQLNMGDLEELFGNTHLATVHKLSVTFAL